MKLHLYYTAASVLAILFMTLHVTDDIVRNPSGAGQGLFDYVIVVLLLTVWLYSTLMLAERKWGYILNLIFALLASAVAVGHMMGEDGSVGQIAASSGPFFAWVVIALGLAAFSAVIFSTYELLNQSRLPKQAVTERGAARRK